MIVVSSQNLSRTLRLATFLLDRFWEEISQNNSYLVRGTQIPDEPVVYHGKEECKGYFVTATKVKEFWQLYKNRSEATPPL
jgi:hypothetical protein